ncbi:MAG: AIR synthase-related protein, partial [Candidatus Oxydemutatoraceae bacterium WSBS_2016_MAG_OTU14]
LLRPIPRIKEGQILQSYANAAIDISDGVFLDLTRILNASKLGAKLNLDQVALNPAIASIPLGEDWLLPYMSGDDYELIFTISPDRVTELKSAWENAKLMTPLSEIGRITEEAGLQCFYQGEAMNLPPVFGFDHFSEPIK